MQPRTDALTQLIDYLREEGPYVLASPEDADFFRKKKLKSEVKLPKETVSTPAPSPPKSIPAPVKTEPLILPAPVIKTAPKEKEEEPLPLKKTSFADLSNVGKVLSIVAPELAILKEIPSDAIATKISERWKTKNQSAPISILLFQEPPEQRALLEQIAKALDLYFMPAKIVNGEKIEKDKQWEAFLSVPDLKIVIVCDYTLWQLSGLMHFYKETPAQGTRMLKDTPLFLLPDLSLYLKDPLLKRSLWKALCQKFS